jgi:hypothetical protein
MGSWRGSARLARGGRPRFWCMGSWRGSARHARGGLRRFWCMGSWRRSAQHARGGRLRFWCMGSWRRRCLSASHLGCVDRPLPWRQRLSLGAHRGTVLRPAEPGGPGRQSRQSRRQQTEIAQRIALHPPTTQQSEHAAIARPRLGTEMPMDRAGLAQTGQAFLGAWPGASAAMHATAQLAAHRRRPAGGAGAGKGATARCQGQVGIAASRRGVRSGVHTMFYHCWRL